MRPGEDPQDAASELRVTDRRRFTSDGDIRDKSAAESEARPSAAPPQPPPAASAPEPAPRVPEHDEAAHRAHLHEEPRGAGAAGPAAGVYDLGIEAVFFVFYQSALIALGASQPGGPPGRVDLAEARQAITFLRVLEQKTRGNLTADEAATLRELLDEAQMAYVQVARAMPGGGA